MILCRKCADRRAKIITAVGVFFFNRKGKPTMANAKYYAEQVSSNDWRVVSGRNMVVATGFDNRAEAEAYIDGRVKAEVTPEPKLKSTKEIRSNRLTRFR